MMGMPYQCIKRCGKVLVAARGSSIDSFNLDDGSLLSTWKYPSGQEPKTASPRPEKPLSVLETQKSESSIEGVLESSPPAKRRKLSTADEESPAQNPGRQNGSKKDQKAGKKGNQRSDAVASGLETPAVIALTATEDGRHVIAVTGEDKSIRVFENTVDGDGKHCLRQLSERAMPKRPCAIAITADDSTIISADKFGDVYSLPLLIPDPSTRAFLEPATPTPEPASAKAFVPAANTLTVHSQRNRKTLENQRKQAAKPTSKPESTFEHTLLLGHVSMLTDLALITLEGRNYILTADRDEHIRVSRGIPQAHIIAGFCLEHKEFISRLCIPRERPDVLVSGGGEGILIVWDWVRGGLLSKTDLRGLLVSVMNGVSEDVEALKIAVSGITHVRQAGSEEVEDLIIISCEGVPAAFTFLLDSQNQLQHIQTLEVHGNVLNITTERDGVVLSIDTIHKPGSITERRKSAAESINSLQKFVFQGRELVPSTIKFEAAKAEDEIKDSARLANLFYGLENLRKRDDGKDEE